MVLGLLVIAGIPNTIGVCEASSAQKKANAAAKEKAKFHLSVTVSFGGEGSVECGVVLKDGLLWVDHPKYPVPGYKFTGYYFTYPAEEQTLGLVSTIADDPPMLNWIFVDKDLGLLRHGGRKDVFGGHLAGPWYWSEDEQWLTLKGDESRFVAVQLENKNWAIGWDGDDSFTSRLCGSSTGNKQSEGKNDVSTSQSSRPRKWVPIRLCRRMQLGMESRYVKGDS